MAETARMEIGEPRHKPEGNYLSNPFWVGEDYDEQRMPPWSGWSTCWWITVEYDGRRIVIAGESAEQVMDAARAVAEGRAEAPVSWRGGIRRLAWRDPSDFDRGSDG